MKNASRVYLTLPLSARELGSDNGSTQALG